MLEVMDSNYELHTDTNIRILFFVQPLFTSLIEKNKKKCNGHRGGLGRLMSTFLSLRNKKKYPFARAHPFIRNSLNKLPCNKYLQEEILFPARVLAPDGHRGGLDRL